MERRAVIFDWGGVLMRTEDYRPRHRWDERLGLSRGQVEQVVHGIEAWRKAQRGELDLDAYWRQVSAELGIDAAAARELRDDFYSGDRLNLDLVELIRELRAHGIRVGLLSNNTPDLPDMMLALEVDDLFDETVISARIGVMKPEPEPYHAILRRLDVAPQQALFVDDFSENAEAARKVGMAAVHYQPGVDLRAEIERWLDDEGGLSG